MKRRNGVDTKNLKYFVGVAQYGSINQAAKAMYISQPQLSHIIKNIEDEVGFSLFQRTNQGSRLTKNGEYFLEHCKVILNEMEHLDQFISQTFQHVFIKIRMLCQLNQCSLLSDKNSAFCDDFS